MEATTYRIIRLEASNIKRLKAIDIVPSSDVVTLKGKNAEGKSSCLDAIFWTLTGRKAIPERPIREGQSRAEATVDLGDFTVSLKISSSTGAKLTIRSKDGLDVRQPQTLLDSYTNEILLDPVKFLRLSETPEGRRKQGETLRKLIGLDFTELDNRKKKAYEERTIANRELSTAQAKLASFPFDAAAPKEEVKVADLMQKCRELEAHAKEKITAVRADQDATLERLRTENQETENGKSMLANSEHDLKMLNETISGLEAKLAEARAEKEQLQLRVKQRQEYVANRTIHKIENVKAGFEAINKEYLDGVDTLLKPVQEQIAQADSLNTKFRQNARHREIKEEIRLAQEKVDLLTKSIEECDQSKNQQLAEARFPLPELSFDENGILLNKLPLGQGSQSEQLKAVLAIGFALKPKIRVALVRDASILDGDSLKQVAAICSEHDAQIWLECVQSDDPKAIVIEDGHIKET